MVRTVSLLDNAMRRTFAVVMKMHVGFLVGHVEVLIAELFVRNMFLSPVTSLKGLHMYVIHVQIIRKQTASKLDTSTVLSMLMLQFADADPRADKGTEYQMNNLRKWML